MASKFQNLLARCRNNKHRKRNKKKANQQLLTADPLEQDPMSIVQLLDLQNMCYKFASDMYTPGVQRRNFATPFQQKKYFTPPMLSGQLLPVLVFCWFDTCFSSLFDVCIWYTWEPMEGNQNLVENMWTRPVFSHSTQIWGYFGGTRVTAKFGSSTAKFVPWHSLALPRLRHGRVTPPYCSHLCFFSFCFMGAVVIYSYSICWGGLRQP